MVSAQKLGIAVIQWSAVCGLAFPNRVLDRYKLRRHEATVVGRSKWGLVAASTNRTRLPVLFIKPRPFVFSPTDGVLVAYRRSGLTPGRTRSMIWEGCSGPESTLARMGSLVLPRSGGKTGF